MMPDCNYKMTANMGPLSAVTIAIALVMGFLLLPALLSVFDHRGTAQKITGMSYSRRAFKNE
jgi:uncharacterized membrane protein YdfJ with MMPL/SSD domain